MSEELVSFKNAVTAMENIKSKKIDIKATIENTKKADFLGDEEAYCQAMNSDDFMPAYFSELVDSEDLSSKDFYDNVFDYLEKDNGIYIALCYLTDGFGDEDNLKFNDNSSLEDDYFILIDRWFEELIAEYNELDLDFHNENNDEYSYFMIDNAFNTISVKTLSKYGLSCDIASDYGISIKKEDEEFKIRFGHRQFTGVGPCCMGPPEFYEFNDLRDPAGEESLDNPLNQLMILLMEKVIIFEE